MIRLINSRRASERQPLYPQRGRPPASPRRSRFPAFLLRGAPRPVAEGLQRAVDADYRPTRRGEDGVVGRIRGAGQGSGVDHRRSRDNKERSSSVHVWRSSCGGPLLQVAPKARWKERGRRAAAILKSFQMTVATQGELTFGFDVEALEGLADSGNLSEDLTDVLVALGEAAQEQGSGVVFLFDEVQFLTTRELEALIAALHKTVQRQLPITLVGAGLPQLPRLAGEAKSYAERLFQFPTIGRLSDEEAADAVTRPAAPLGVTLTDDAVGPQSSTTHRAIRTSFRSTARSSGTTPL